MDPLTALTTIIGLLSIFKQESANQNNQSAQNFTRWLEAHKHEQLKEFILASHDIEREIDVLLQQDHQQIIAKLEGMDHILAAILCKVEGLGAIGQAIHPGSVLSDQALSILRQLVSSSAKEFGKRPLQQNVSLSLVPDGGEIAVTDFRFLDDDLRTLLDLGFLNCRVGAHGTEFYGVTRKAAKYIDYLNSQQSEHK